MFVLRPVWLFAVPWPVFHKAPLPMGFSRQEYQSGVPFPTPGDLPDPGVELTSTAFPALAGGFLTNGATWKCKSLNHVQLYATPWTIESMEFSRPKYWSGYPFHSPGDLPNKGIKPRSPTLQAFSLPAEPQGKPWI